MNEQNSNNMRTNMKQIEQSQLPERYKNLKVFIPDELEKQSEFQDSLYKDLDAGSITPTVLKERFYDTIDLERAKESVELQHAELMRLQSALEDSTTGFGKVSDSMHRPLTKQKDAPALWKALALQKELTTMMAKKLEKYVEEYEFSSTPQKWFFIEENTEGIKRYGIDPIFCKEVLPKDSKQDIDDQSSTQDGKSSTSKQQSTTKKILHPIEVFLLSEALKSLPNDKGVVLVDIFERDNRSGKVNPDKKVQNVPLVHTIILYKEAEQITILDPTNSKSSKHLAIDINEILWQINNYFNLSSEPSSQGQQYYQSPGPNTGPHPNQFRDCVDIAYKLATIIMKSGFPDTPENVKELTIWDPILQITNNPSYNELLTQDFKENALRIRQTSNEECRKKFNEQLERISNLESNDESRGQEITSILSLVYSDEHQTSLGFFNKIINDLSLVGQHDTNNSSSDFEASV